MFSRNSGTVVHDTQRTSVVGFNHEMSINGNSMKLDSWMTFHIRFSKSRKTFHCKTAKLELMKHKHAYNRKSQRTSAMWLQTAIEHKPRETQKMKWKEKNSFAPSSCTATTGQARCGICSHDRVFFYWNVKSIHQHIRRSPRRAQELSRES